MCCRSKPHSDDFSVYVFKGFVGKNKDKPQSKTQSKTELKLFKQHTSLYDTKKQIVKVPKTGVKS